MIADRILLYNDSSTLDGGAEEIMKREQESLRDSGHTVKSVGLGALTQETFTDEVVPEPRSRFVREIAGLSVSIRIYRNLRSKINHFEPDVIHLHKSQKYPATVALATRGYPSVKTHHDYSAVCPSAWGVKQDNKEVCECGIGAKCWRHGCRSLPVVVGHYGPRHIIQRRVERRIIDRHIAPSGHLTQYLNEFGYETRQIPNPESVRLSTEQSDEGYFLFLGRLSEEKGTDVLIDAVGILSSRGMFPPIKIAGSGPLEPELQERVRESGHDNVDFLGYVPEEQKSSLYDGARAVVVPSIWMENYPTVVLEAMAHGKPVIGSDRGGIQEMVEHGYNGLLYDATDHERLAEHIASLAEKPTKAYEMGTSGAEWLCANSNYNQFVERLEQLFQDVLNTY